MLSARDEEAAQAVAAGLRDAKAANTRRVYASAWHEFNVWTHTGLVETTAGQSGFPPIISKMFVFRTKEKIT